ncbi:hypothetical protein FNV43_RR06917 [Rhamnella rubrinervis]|uniref:Uncharacterized protein n=1 Tax=Rhamnella rubrinervis TaxID=2594499 RepID=A0A8K0HET8_9ROSA|nr:hypothetical protein FNV43_RR06917 [Rhamnella rubrinervis]
MPCNVESASLEPKLGNNFIAGGEDMWVREEIGCNNGPVHCVRFSPGGESYASGSEDTYGTIRIWHLDPKSAKTHTSFHNPWRDVNRTSKLVEAILFRR